MGFIDKNRGAWRSWSRDSSPDGISLSGRALTAPKSHPIEETIAITDVDWHDVDWHDVDFTE